MIYTLMGVSGCGKTTIGQMLAQKMSLEFFDADDFHTDSNKLRMKNNIPLNDEDRSSWLAKLAKNIVLWNKSGDAILACSALKQKYRDVLSSQSTEDVVFIYLKGEIKLVDNYIRYRKKHFFSRVLLESQYEILEEPEKAIVIRIDSTPENICNKIVKKINIQNMLA